jgi:hypothetical protein
MSNFNEYNNQNFNQGDNFINNMGKENFVNMASSIDLDNLNGTNIMDLNKNNLNSTLNPTQNISSFNMPNNIPLTNYNSYNNMSTMPTMPTMSTMPTTISIPQINNVPFINNIPPIGNIESGQDKHLIKSITREIMNNLKENNISLHDDNTTYQSKRKNSEYDNIELSNQYDLTDNPYINNHENSENSNEKKKSKKSYKYKDEIKKGVEHMLSENGVPASEDVSSYIFDDLFNLKDVIVLFGVYFLLSQEMIKDLFAQYFTSLNPDDTGKVHVKGVIIYGLILTILFMVFRKLV